jgi:hypothetical protein
VQPDERRRIEPNRGAIGGPVTHFFRFRWPVAHGHSRGLKCHCRRERGEKSERDGSCLHTGSL